MKDYDSPNIQHVGDERITWNGLDAYGMAAVLDDLFGAGTFDDDQWNEWFRDYGSPYRVK